MNRVARNATPTPHAPPPVSPRRNKTKSCALRLSTRPTDARSDRGLKSLSRPEPSTSTGGATPRGRPSGRSRGGSVGGVVKTSPGVLPPGGPGHATAARRRARRGASFAARLPAKDISHVRRDPALRDAAAFGRPRRSSLRTNPYDYPARLKPSPLWRYIPVRISARAHHPRLYRVCRYTYSSCTSYENVSLLTHTRIEACDRMASAWSQRRR